MMKIFLQEALSTIKDSYVFIDTCILLDIATSNKDIKEEFIAQLFQFRDNGCSFITVESVAVEFFLGSSRQNLEIKKEYFNRLIDTVIPVRSLKKEIVEELIIEYGEDVKGSLSYTDLCLGVAIKQYPKSLLLTRNYKDFPSRLFNCLAAFIVPLYDDVKTYCFYEYNPIK